MLIIAQIIVSVIIIILVLLQERSSGLSGFLGGGSGGTPYQTRRGVEKLIFWGTVVAGTAFILLAIGNIVF